ncbi:MAG: integration host factor subunit beta [Deltaproteobacteria bacterium RIFCSPLOWO2_01_44_7]|nr:MAG: integration host factor subunit beta [Deltaproteobacteria bacterium RIFCSPHIGHO2_01_FULL_43_49]OGQ15609.1 MAG: integration host factor subunit beta [Deltaproteobacteria bacterium RIFCSPHIGHO2_02_FULL_44_53]OGQ28312.1 MAG: integration host factor subunit beta [Deltaproteobacteria bacterium RIFCSPHIGHO2_12_FULL_44_21]OGQ31899.1 MAG: integration host factor subunit beta [Deltaproteobacteria bacterium RIFCSPLOWO2_01_FULL_45_74]OGQ38276.1 MAG: integration host factor subunit beta [Deltaprote
MNKSDLVQAVTSKLPTLAAKDVEVIVNTIFDSMTRSLSQGDRIEIRGFGSFEVRVRKPRQGRNPKTGRSVQVGTRRVPFFKVGKELKEKVNNHG